MSGAREIHESEIDLFAQIIAFLPKRQFLRFVERYKGN
jgi:hypothetical protein